MGATTVAFFGRKCYVSGRLGTTGTTANMRLLDLSKQSTKQMASPQLLVSELGGRRERPITWGRTWHDTFRKNFGETEEVNVQLKQIASEDPYFAGALSASGANEASPSPLMKRATRGCTAVRASAHAGCRWLDEAPSGRAHANTMGGVWTRLKTWRRLRGLPSSSST
jgi:hypothetical protein